MGRSEERLSHGGAPVDQQPTTRAVREAEAPDVDRLGAVRADHVTEAQVQAETTQCAQASAQSMDLQVPVHRLLADAAGGPSLGIEALGQICDRLLEALRHGGEMLLVPGDQPRLSLGREMLGKVECTGGGQTAIVRHDGGLAARPGVRYTLKVERERVPSTTGPN